MTFCSSRQDTHSQDAVIYSSRQDNSSRQNAVINSFREDAVINSFKEDAVINSFEEDAVINSCREVDTADHHQDYEQINK